MNHNGLIIMRQVPWLHVVSNIFRFVLELYWLMLFADHYGNIMVVYN
jgi:hypothetical protein